MEPNQRIAETLAEASGYGLKPELISAAEEFIQQFSYMTEPLKANAYELVFELILAEYEANKTPSKIEKSFPVIQSSLLHMVSDLADKLNHQFGTDEVITLYIPNWKESFMFASDLIRELDFTIFIADDESQISTGKVIYLDYVWDEESNLIYDRLVEICKDEKNVYICTLIGEVMAPNHYMACVMTDIDHNTVFQGYGKGNQYGHYREEVGINLIEYI